jgi:hypothetical protein
MTQPSVQSFFSSSTGRTVKFPEVGASVTGTIIAVHPPEQQTTPQGDPVTWKNGEPKMQIRIEVQTDERNPEIEYDDGSRVLYVKGKMQGAVGDALRKAGAQTPEVGGKITVTFSGEEPNPGLSPTKLYTASYEKPSGAAASAAGFFGNGAESAKGDLPEKPAAMSAEAWAAMPDDTKRQVAAAMSDQPPF